MHARARIRTPVSVVRILQQNTDVRGFVPPARNPRRRQAFGDAFAVTVGNRRVVVENAAVGADVEGHAPHVPTCCRVRRARRLHVRRVGHAREADLFGVSTEAIGLG